MPECYVTKMEYQLKCDKPIHKGGWGNRRAKMAIISVVYFLNDPYCPLKTWLLAFCNRLEF